MSKRRILWLLLCIMAIISFAMVHFSTSKYTQNIDTAIKLTITMPQYKVRFHPNNGGTDNYSDQTFTYGTSQSLNANTFTNSGYSFNGWNTEDDGTGTSYSDEQSVNNLTSVNNAVIDLYAMWIVAGNMVAEVNGVQFATLGEAIAAVPDTGVATTLKVLKDIALSNFETISSQKNIVLNLQNFTITTTQNATGPVFENAGTLSVSNGTLTCTTKTAVINNTGTLVVSGGTITGKAKQALYNDGGTLTITGTPVISTTSAERAAVHNFNSGTLIITGGTITATAYHAIENLATLTIGAKDGTVDTTTPVIQGNTYAISHADKNAGVVNFNFYDGIIKGRTATINTAKAAIADIETGYEVVNSVENVNGQSFKTEYLSAIVVRDNITFDENYQGGTQYVLNLPHGDPIGTLPAPIRAGYVIEGWYTESVGGTKISSSTLVNGDTTYFAHWELDAEAKIGNKYYETVHKAVTAVTTSTPTTIEVLKDVSYKTVIKVNAGRNITFDLGGHTISNLNSENIPIIENFGTTTITNGTITSDANQGALNNKGGGTLNIFDGVVAATGPRQAIYNDAGTVNIGGTVQISAVTNERGAVQNQAGATINITGGTITSTNYSAVVNSGTMTIGTQGTPVSITSPSIRGNDYGISSTGTLTFYDGIVRGITGGISGTVTSETGYHIDSTHTETIGNKTYHTAYLVED